MRLVGEVQRLAPAHGLEITVRDDRGLDVTLAHTLRARLLPLVGHPDAAQIHAAHAGSAATAHPPEARVLYDAMGMLSAKTEHLRWLNEFLPLKALGLDEVGTCLSTWSKSVR